MRKHAWLLAILSTASCVSMTPEEDAVRLTTNPQVVEGCRFLSNVSTNGMAAASQGDSENRIKKAVHKAGGNVAYVTTFAPGKTGLAGNSYSTEAYSCPDGTGIGKFVTDTPN